MGIAALKSTRWVARVAAFLLVAIEVLLAIDAASASDIPKKIRALEEHEAINKRAVVPASSTSRLNGKKPAVAKKSSQPGSQLSGSAKGNNSVDGHKHAPLAGQKPSPKAPGGTTGGAPLWGKKK